MYEAAGKLKVINDTQTFPSGFTKREFVVTTQDRYPQDLKFEIVKDKCSMLDSFTVGQDVQVTFDIRGNEYNGKYFVNLSCWKIQGTNGSEAPSSPAHTSQSAARPPQQRQAGPASSTYGEPSLADIRNENDFDDSDDIPF